MPLLEIKGLKTHFYTEDGLVRAVDGVDYSIEPKRTLGVVGESGCGKSVTALSILGLVQPPGAIVAGEILFRTGASIVDLASLPPKGRAIRSIRGNEIAMIFQEPMTALNPVYTIGKQIRESISLHQNLGRAQVRRRAIEMLYEVGIPLPEQRATEFPHQLSGGMRQRAMIAMALSCNPSLLIADEPTTALDVTIQAQVLDLMRNLQRDFETSIQFITHDLGVIAGMADDIVVMYLGRIVERASVGQVFHNPMHPYTQGLLRSFPSLTTHQDRLEPIRGLVPDALDLPPGCGFEPRCPSALDVCSQRAPYLIDVGPDHQAACWLHCSEGDEDDHV